MKYQGIVVFLVCYMYEPRQGNIEGWVQYCRVCIALGFETAHTDVARDNIHIACPLGGDSVCSLACGFSGGCCGHHGKCHDVCYCSTSGYAHRCGHCDI